MKYAIEYGGAECKICGDMVMVEGDCGLHKYITYGKTINVCAWCDKDKAITKRLLALGYETSHGICEQCSEKEFGHKLNNDNL